MTNKKPVNINEVEWGNIELPGFGDDKLLSPNVNKTLANRANAKDPKWIEAKERGQRAYIDSPDYVNPKGMLGKKHKEGHSELMSNKLTGKAKPVEGNKKISIARKGIKRTDEEIKKISQTLTGKETGRKHSVVTPLGKFEKIKDAGIAHNVHETTIRLWIKTKPNEFRYDENHTAAKKISTPDGIFDNIREAAKFYEITPQAMRARVKSKSGKYSYIEV